MNKPIFLVIGDSFLVKEKVHSILQPLMSKDKDLLSKEVFYLSECPMEKILEQARTLPFLVEKQVFIINQVEKIKKEEADSFLNYLEKPNPHTFLILCGEKMDKRGLLYKGLVKEKIEITFFEESDQTSATSRFIVQKLRQFGKKIDPKAQRRLEGMVGDSPSFLDSILTQLIIYADAQDVLTEQMLEKFEERIADIDVFELTNAIAAKRTDLALKLFNEYMEENDTDIFSLMGLLHWQLRRLWQASVYLDEGQDPTIIAKKCRISSYQSNLFFDQLRKLSRKKIELSIENLFLLDKGIKTGEAQDKIGLERWIVELTA